MTAPVFVDSNVLLYALETRILPSSELHKDGGPFCGRTEWDE